MWFTIQGQQVKMQVIAKPNAKKSAIVKITEQGLHIALHAKPHKGEANIELIEFLSKEFDVPKSLITLKTGQSSKFKQIIMPLTPALNKLLKDESCKNSFS